jgi:uncharacterized protein (DUF433 family)
MDRVDDEPTVAYVKGVTAELKARLDQAVWVNPQRMSGTPCFRNTRAPVQSLIDFLESGETIDEFLKLYPSVTREQVLAVLDRRQRVARMRLLIDECVDPRVKLLFGDHKAVTVHEQGWDTLEHGPLLRNSRKTDSLPAAKSAEFLFRFVPPEAAFAPLRSPRTSLMFS